MSRETYERWDVEVPPALAWYGFAQFVVALVGAFVLLGSLGSLPVSHVAAGGFYIAVTLAGIAGVFELARWAGPIETARLLVLAGVSVALWWAGLIGLPWMLAGVGFCLGSLVWFLPRRHLLTEMDLAPVM